MLMLYMSRMLSELLHAREPQFSLMLGRFERASGNMGVDVRITADIVQKYHHKFKELGLDVKDTTGPELYRALMNLVAQHDMFINKRLGGSDNTNVEAIQKIILQAFPGLDIATDVWVLKKSVLRRLLKKQPPKMVMKRLRYRSIDSLLKREDPCELLAYARLIETQKWLTDFSHLYKTLQPIDFEIRPIELIQLTEQRAGVQANDFVRNKGHNVLTLKEAGLITMLPLPVKTLPGLTLNLLSTILHYAGELRSYSAYFKSRQVQNDLGDVVAKTIAEDITAGIDLHGQDVHWRTVYRHLSSGLSAEAGELFEPHVSPEDFEYQTIEEVLYRLEPALYFWYETDYVGVLADHHVISLNLRDMAVNYTNNLPYGKHSVANMRAALWQEITLSYMRRPPIEQMITRQLQNQSYEPNVFSVQLMGVR